MSARTLDTRFAEVASGRACAERAEVAPASLREVYDRHVDYVFRCLRSLGVAPSDLDDAVQDVFLVVHDKLAAFDGRHKLSTWLYAIVIRIARRYRARRASGPREAELELVDSRDAEQRLASSQALALAQRALDALSEDKREVFVLCEVEQMSAPEVAAITDTPLNTVYSRLRAARQEFERRMDALERQEWRVR
jgi:RNA polymerase sigma-70 factor (ECF subfamily)